MISFDEYERKKQNLCAQSGEAKNLRLGKTTSNLFRHRVDAHDHVIDVRDFNNVIAIDPVALVADVEGMTTYETLFDETARLGLMPAVVPEFKTITVGGATTGIGLEASSFRYGFVHETVEEIEVLLPDGQTIVCSKTKNSDLFYGFPNSYGTLGYALRLRIKLLPIRPYVKVNHRRYNDFETYFKEMTRVCAEPLDFIDGTIFSADEMYITTGTLVDTAPYQSDYTYMNIYYKSIRRNKEDYMTTRDFIWRWDTDWYWGSRYFGAEYSIVRFLLGKDRLRSSYYWKLRSQLNKTPFWNLLSHVAEYETVVQDVDIPIDEAAEFMDFQFQHVGIRPVWVCPVNALNKQIRYPFYPLAPSTTYVNLGLWGIVQTTHEPGYYNRLLEAKVTELQGRKILYSDSFYSRDEFRELYGGDTYALLKDKYDPQHAFKTLYEKCVTKM